MILLINLSCTQRTAKTNPQPQNKSTPQLKWDSGIELLNGPGRGTFYKDSLANEYGHGHLTSTVTNDTTLSMHLKLHFAKEYHCPAPHSDQKFKVIVWPDDLNPDSVTGPDSISNELRDFLAYGTDTTYSIDIVIAPQEKYELTFGTIQQYPTTCYVSPNMLFVQNDVDLFPKCDDLAKHDQSANPPTELRLRLDFANVGCSIVSLGQVSYGEP